MVGKSGEMLTVKRNGIMKEVAVRQIESVVVLQKAQISHDAIVLLAQQGVPILYMYGMRPLSMMMPFASHGFVMTRRAQFAAYGNEKGRLLSASIIRAAMINKARLLKYYARNRRRTDSSLADTIMHSATEIEWLLPELERIPEDPIQEWRSSLMGVEGTAANHYFSGLTHIIRPEFEFEGRNRRPPKDPINAALSYGYALLAKQVMVSLCAAGLEPYGGFIHADRSGRPSLVYDLIEEFRQPVVDRFVIRMFQNRTLQLKDFDFVGEEGGVRFSEDAQKRYLADFFFFLRKEGYKAGNMVQTFPQIMLGQARKMVRFLTGKIPEYEGFMFNW
jgi:CRISPR-associated protein Cas1